MNRVSSGESAPRLLASILTGGREPADLYSVDGARLYEEFAAFDDSEQKELLRLLSQTGGDILELACGGGRLTLPMLALGRPVTGIDLSAEMIRILRDRYDRLPGSRRRVPLATLVADMRDFALGRRFGAIVLATTSVSLLDSGGRQELFAAVARHLIPEGRFFVTVHDSPLRPGATSTRIVPLPGDGRSVAVLSDVVDDTAQRREITALRVVRGDDGGFDVGAFASTVFVVSPEELDAELEAAGLVRVVSTGVASSADETGLRILGYAA